MANACCVCNRDSYVCGCKLEETWRKKIMWEKIDETSDRLRVKNGWVVRSYLKQAVHQVFVHDEFGTWDLGEFQSTLDDKEEPNKNIDLVIFEDTGTLKVPF